MSTSRIVMKYLGWCPSADNVIKVRDERATISRSSLMIITILIASNLFLFVTFQQASQTLHEANAANQKLENLLILRERRPAESSREVYDDLERIGCTVTKLETQIAYVGEGPIEVDDYFGFMTLAQGYQVKMSQDITFDWNPLQLTWMDNAHLLTTTPRGTVEWRTTFRHIEFIIGVDTVEVFEAKLARRMEIFEEHGLFDATFRLDESEAAILGGRFLTGLGYQTSKGFFVKLETRAPNSFWHDLTGIAPPEAQGRRECWVFRSSLKDSQGTPLGAYEVWIDAYTTEIMGGQMG